MIDKIKIDENNIGNRIGDAIENKDETLLKELILSAMAFYLEDKLTKEELDVLATMYLTIPIELKWEDEFKFKDNKLHYVMEELSAIEVVEDKRARENVKRFILYLQDKEYEKLET